MPSSWIGANNAYWHNASSWSGGVADAIDAVANFNFFNQTTLATALIQNAQTITIGTLNVNNATAGLTIEGDYSVIGTQESWLTFSTSTGSATVNNNSSGSLQFLSSSVLRLNLASDTVFNAASTGAIMIYAPIFGSGKIIKNGPGDLLMNGFYTNATTGGMQINGGAVELLGSLNAGSGAITIANNATLRFSGTTTIANTIGTASGSSTSAGSANLQIEIGTLTLAGSLSHLGAGTFTFGSTGVSTFINANLTGIGHNATQSSYAIAGGVLQMGNSGTAQNLLYYNGTGTTSIASGAWLNTGGFSTRVANLDLNGGGIYTTTGQLLLSVYDRTGSTSNQNGRIDGSSGADLVNIFVLGNGTTGNYDLSATTFNNWTAGTDAVNIIGSGLNNALIGSQVGDNIQGAGGTDLIQSGAGDDQIILIDTNDGTWVDGGSGTDRLTISSGSVTPGTLANLEAIELVGGASLTLSAAQFNAGFYNAIAQIAVASISGSGSLVFNMTPDPVTSTLYLTTLSFAGGSSVTVTINGTSGIDAVKGAPGASNTMNGGDGIDQLRGGNQSDTLNGGAGDDKLFGWGGADVLTGGTGSDQFRYFFATDSGTGVNADRITDFEIGFDKFNFVLIDADPVTPDDQAFAFLGTGAFTSPGTGQIRYQNSGADLLVQVDVDGNGTVDMEMILQGLAGSTLTSANFML